MHLQHRGWALCLSCLLGCWRLAAPAAGQTTNDHRIHGAALVHLVTELFPADSSPARPHCLGVFSQDIDQPPADPAAKPAADPSSAVIELVRRSVPHVLPLSACPPPAADPSSLAAEELARRPIIYYAGAVQRTRAGATVTIAYWLHTLNGGGWECELRRAQGRWTIRDCRPLWIS